MKGLPNKPLQPTALRPAAERQALGRWEKAGEDRVVILQRYSREPSRWASLASIVSSTAPCGVAGNVTVPVPLGS